MRASTKLTTIYLIAREADSLPFKLWASFSTVDGLTNHMAFALANPVAARHVPRFCFCIRNARFPIAPFTDLAVYPCKAKHTFADGKLIRLQPADVSGCLLLCNHCSTTRPFFTWTGSRVIRAAVSEQPADVVTVTNSLHP